MNRRTFLQSGMMAGIAVPVWAALRQERLDDADAVLAKAVASGQVNAAVLHVVQRKTSLIRRYGGAASDDAMFLLGSISKPICVTALMTLFDQGKFQLDDPLKKFIPEFTGNGKENVSVRHLLTHVSGLPDQLPENNTLRKNHASLQEFVDHAVRTPLQFAPGTRYQYSSMAILLGTRIAQIITGEDLLGFVNRTVFQPLKMNHSAIGLGRFELGDMVPCQTEHAAPESGAGDPSAKDWDWNSPYWRKLGAPWGGVHASAPDIARWLTEFLLGRGNVVKPDTAKLMISNHNGPGLTPRGLGFDIGVSYGPEGSKESFGHTGSTGTMAWADPATETICVVLTSLPGRAVSPHPRDVATKLVANATR